MKETSFINKLISIADKISTRPNYTSWCWKGYVSPLAYLILHIIYISRLLSLLQISKFIYRFLKKIYFKSFSIDKASKRINVPAYFVEIYFITWCILLFAIPKEWVYSKYLSFYFMGESFFWLLYYFFFRRFFEEHYAIMHTLEYIVVLPLLIITQVRCISIVFKLDFLVALSTLFFPSSVSNIYIVVLSVLYTALIFGIFLSNLPIEQVKETGNYRYNIAILGNGEIVKKRLKPAIARITPSMNVAIMDIHNEDLPKETVGFAKFSYYPIDENTTKNIIASNILWIATPSYVHFKYLTQYINDIYIAIEKPLVTSQAELYALKRMRQNGIWKKVFCLSYYYLEKALPLTFLYNPHFFYEKYLEFSNSDREYCLACFEHMGKIQSINLNLYEGEDARSWVDVESYGGHMFETFLHLAMITRMVTLSDNDWKTENWSIKNSGNHYMTTIKYIGKTKQGNIQINLNMGKFVPESELKRDGILTFENGKLLIDFNTQMVTGEFFNSSKENFVIKTKDEFVQSKYSIQLDMVRRCYYDNLQPQLFDGSDLQIETLEWLFEERKKWEQAITTS